MIIYIKDDTTYILYDNDYEITDILDNFEDNESAILLLNSSTYHVKYKSEENYKNELIGMIIDIIKNKTNTIITYNLNFMIKHFDKFKDCFKILFNYNQYLFVENFLYVSHENKKIINTNIEYFKKIISDNKIIDNYNKANLYYIFDIYTSINEKDNDYDIATDIVCDNIKYNIKYNHDYMLENCNIYCISTENEIELFETTFDLEKICKVDGSIGMFIKVNHYVENTLNFSISDYGSFYCNIQPLLYMNEYKLIDYDLKKIIEHCTEDENDLHIDNIIKIYKCDKELFKDKLKNIDVELLKKHNLLSLLELK